MKITCLVLVQKPDVYLLQRNLVVHATLRQRHLLDDLALVLAGIDLQSPIPGHHHPIQPVRIHIPTSHPTKTNKINHKPHKTPKLPSYAFRPWNSCSSCRKLALSFSSTRPRPAPAPPSFEGVPLLLFGSRRFPRPSPGCCRGRLCFAS